MNAKIKNLQRKIKREKTRRNYPMTKTKMRKAQARIFHHHPNQSRPNIKRPHTFLVFFFIP